jgi:hypothetical protein
MSDATKRKSVPVRFNAARSDASVASIRKSIEEIFDLPEGSVQLVRPDGSKKRSDASIASLREEWNV